MIGNSFVFEKLGEPEIVLIWPPLRGRHFRGFAVDFPVGGVRPEDNVLPVHFVDGMWYVQQVFRETTIFPSPLVNASDCQPHGALR